MGKFLIFYRIQLKFRFWLYKKRWHTSWKFQFEKTSNKNVIVKKPLTNLYEMNSSIYEWQSGYSSVLYTFATFEFMFAFLLLHCICLGCFFLYIFNLLLILRLKLYVNILKTKCSIYHSQSGDVSRLLSIERRVILYVHLLTI